MMLPVVKYDAAYVGVSLFSMTAACLLKSMNHQMRVVVINNPQIPPDNYGLNPSKDSINFMLERIDEIQRRNLILAQREALRDLRQRFEVWKESPVCTKEMETILIEISQKIGVVFFPQDTLGLKAYDVKRLLDPSTDESQSELGQLLNAEVIIVGEGKDSPIRNGLFDNKLSESLTPQYLIELNFQYVEPSLDLANKNQEEKNKKVTLHSFASKELYDSLRVGDSQGKIKGDYNNPWKLDELSERAKQDRYAREVHMQILRFLTARNFLQGKLKKAKIATRDLSVYRSERAFMKHNGRYVLLGGDAFSGMLDKGCNKAIMEAALNAIAINDYFLKRLHSSPGSNPFQHYESELIRIYENEKWWALKKVVLITWVSWIVGLFKNWVFQPINSPEEPRLLLENKMAETTIEIKNSVHQ